MAGAPLGNQNAKSAKRWQEAILRALARNTKATVEVGLDEAADKLVKLAFRGDKWAIDHLADRVDGKPPQSTTISGEDGGPIEVLLTFVRPSRGSAG